jgi:MFS family permease
MIGRVFDPARQTSAMGLRESIGNITGSVAGLGVIMVLSRIAFPTNFLVLFCCFLVAYSMCLVWISRLREAPVAPARPETPARHLREILRLPRADPEFRWFVLFIFLSYGSLFVGSLYTTIGIQRFGATMNPDRLAGVMTFLMLASTSVFSLILSRVADRWGRFWGYLPSVVLSVLLPLWAAVARSLVGYLSVFALLGALNAVWFIEMFATLGYAPPERRHLTIAFLSLAKVVPITLYINLGGWIAERVSPVLTLVLSSLFCLGGLAILIFKLGPRWQTPLHEAHVGRRD